MTLIDTTASPSPGAAAHQSASAPGATVFNLDTTAVRELNRTLHHAQSGAFTVLHPGGRHNIAVGLTTQLEVTVDGHAGYYCAGMNQRATVRITGNTAVGVAENMMSGRVEVHGAAGQAAAASAHGGLLVVRGNAAARCGISLKGGDIVVEGSVGHATGFMSQKGRILICGDAGEALGDSLYETRIYVRGTVASLGADCVEKPLTTHHLSEVAGLLAQAGRSDLSPSEFRRYGSARELYHFTADRLEAK